LFSYSHKNADGRGTIGVFFRLIPFGCCLLTLSAPAFAAERQDFQPFATRDQNLFNLIHGQPTPANGRLLSSDTSELSTTLVIANTINIESDSDESMLIDYESYRFNVSYQYGISDDWNLQIDLPVVHLTGGRFDSAIDSWHQFFGMPRGYRPTNPEGRYRIEYINDQANIQLDEDTTDIGDIQLAIAHQVFMHDDSALSVWGGIKLPTGDEDKLTGSGSADLSAWLAYNRELARDWTLNLNTGLVVTGGDDYKGMTLNDSALFGSAMINWRAWDPVSLKVQLQAHSSYYHDSNLRILSDAYILNFGGTIYLDCSTLDIAFSEDIKVDASPDGSLLVSWHVPFTAGARGSASCRD
jgi:hypothetical protein